MKVKELLNLMVSSDKVRFLDSKLLTIHEGKIIDMDINLDDEEVEQIYPNLDTLTIFLKREFY